MVDWNMAIKASKQWTLGLVLLQTLGPGHGAAVTLHFGWWLEWVNGLKPTRIGIYCKTGGNYQGLVEIQSTDQTLQEV